MTIKRDETWKLENGKYKCPICAKEVSKAGITSHIWRVHSEKGQKHHANLVSVISKNYVHPFKGQTKETNPTIKRLAELSKTQFDTGLRTPPFRGKKLSEEMRSNISKGRRKFLAENPDKVPFDVNGWKYRRSFLEIKLEEEFVRQGVTGWHPDFKVGPYRYDFAFVAQKVDVEVDGSQHNLPKEVEHDRIRDSWSVSQGWRVLRIPGKLLYHNIGQVIKEVREFLVSTETMKKVEYKPV